ncbi:MAG: formylglycine-generating enzyme family protein [Lentimicrobiaceae bacterium]|nr:formylglycine-generating enzyme family protein [Lentimicrobiaceae bacterium]
MNFSIRNLALLGLISFQLNAQQHNEMKSMELIPEGKYLPLYSGNNNFKTTGAFYIDRYPVTNQEFKKFVRDNPEWGKLRVKSLFADKGYLRHWNDENSFEDKLKDSPVVNVSWFAAQKFCECQGKRLPTTDEWERVAAAGLKSADGSKEKDFQQWILMVTSRPQQKPIPDIGSTKQNFYGIWDMHGLIWEWTYDFNSSLSSGGSRGNTGSGNDLFCGGGGAQSGDVENYAAFLRYALRSSLKAGHVLQNLGFRCVSDVENISEAK